MSVAGLAWIVWAMVMYFDNIMDDMIPFIISIIAIFLIAILLIAYFEFVDSASNQESDNTIFDIYISLAQSTSGIVNEKAIRPLLR